MATTTKNSRQLTAIIEREGDGFVALPGTGYRQPRRHNRVFAGKSARGAGTFFRNGLRQGSGSAPARGNLHHLTGYCGWLNFAYFQARKLCSILLQHHFTEVRRRGRHVVMQKKTADGSITIPVPDHSELRAGTLQAIIRQSGLARAVFGS